MTYMQIGDTNPIARGAYYFCQTIERGSHQFPLNIFFGLQSFAVCQWVSDFVGGVVEYPLAMFQMYMLINDKSCRIVVEIPTVLAKQKQRFPSGSQPDQIQKHPHGYCLRLHPMIYMRNLNIQSLMQEQSIHLYSLFQSMNKFFYL